MLTAVDEFVGIGFEQSQLETSGSTHVVPTWEAPWKAKAGAELDPTRIGAWRRELTEEQLWLMNLLFGKYLRLLNYPDADVSQRLSPQLIAFAAGRFAYAARRHVTVARQLRRIGIT
jgi:hypothetical protein